jgi:hypothetical protein
MVASIEGWKKITKILIHNFQSITFQHIFRVFNSDADSLSKHALMETEGLITFYKWTNGEEISRRKLKIH